MRHTDSWLNRCLDHKIIDILSILIADSGASNTRWIICTQGQKLAEYDSIGLNPNVVDGHIRYQELETLARRIHQDHRPSLLFFYGSGLSDPMRVKRLEDDMKAHFPNVRIHLENDLLAAVRSTGRKTGIVAILGTGSIACAYEDGQIRERKGGHGYLVGDEGSGQDLGKALLQGLLYKRLPKHVHDYVLAEESKSLHELKMGVYTSERPSAYLSALARHLASFFSEPQVWQLIQSRFEVFLQTTILQLPQMEEPIVDFVGSVAYFFEDILKSACMEAGLTCGKMNRSPMEGLIEYHSKDEM